MKKFVANIEGKKSIKVLASHFRGAAEARQR